jgi:hypothetical protein
MRETEKWHPIRPGACCLCGLRPLPRSLTDAQAMDVLFAWTMQNIHAHDYAARWTSALEAASKLQRQRDDPGA